MATISITSSDASGGIPSAPQRVAVFTANLGDDYAANGWDVTSGLPEGSTVTGCNFVLMYDGAALRHGRVEMVSGVARLKVYDNDNGAPGTETVTADQSGNTGITFVVHVE